MKKRFHFIPFGMFIFFYSVVAWGDSCPHPEDFNPTTPPAGWSLIVPPIIPGETYFFDEAIHSLNGQFYYKQVLCIYKDTLCPSPFCPAFTLLSDKTYDLPNSKMPPWNAPSTIVDTLTCESINHRPEDCVFQ